jgi:hypothetical protein
MKQFARIAQAAIVALLLTGATIGFMMLVSQRPLP